MHEKARNWCESSGIGAGQPLLSMRLFYGFDFLKRLSMFIFPSDKSVSMTAMNYGSRSTWT